MSAREVTLTEPAAEEMVRRIRSNYDELRNQTAHTLAWSGAARGGLERLRLQLDEYHQGRIEREEIVDALDETLSDLGY